MGEMFYSHKLFLSNDLLKCGQCVFSALLSLWHFSKNSNRIEWLLLGIKLLVLFSSTHLIVFSLYCLFRHFWHSHFLQGACMSAFHCDALKSTGGK